MRLESDKLVPIRGENLTLSCLTSNLFDSGIIIWYNPAGTELSKCFVRKRCTAYNNEGSYNFTTDTSGAYAYINGLNRSRDGGTWTCVHYVDIPIASNRKNITIYASPQGVKIVEPIPPEGDLGMESITLKCQTNRCASPAPNITWHYKKDGQIIQYLGSSGKTDIHTSKCIHQEAMYTNTLELSRGTNFSGNIPLKAKFLCGVTHESFPGKTRYSNASNDVIFAVQVSIVNLVDSASRTKVFYEGFPQTLICISSPSRPVPIIKWSLQTKDTTTYLSENITETNTTDTNGLHVLTSNITIFPGRDQMDQKIFCAGYINGQPSVVSNSVQIAILYQANKPEIREYGAKSPWLQNHTLTLSCHTTDYGNPVSNVIWIRERGTIDSNGNLVISELIPADNGKKVFCQLANNYTIRTNISLMSEPKILSIEYPPIIEFNTTSPLTVNETRSVSVLCSAKGNPEPDQPSWGRRSADSTLRFDNISRTDRGKYICEASANSLKYGMLKKSKEIDILVQYAPDLSVTIKGSAHQNMTSTVTCEAKGFPPKYTFHPWNHKVEEVEIRSGLQGIPESNTSSSTNILTLDRLSLQDMGTYICSADNSIEGINGHAIQTGIVVLKVQGMPEVINRKDNTFAGETGSSVNISIPFYSDPAIMNFTFLRNGSEVKNKSRTMIYLHKDIVDLMFYNTTVKLEVSTANMLIQNLTEADFNDYILVLENAHNKTEFKLQLNASGPPLMMESFYYNKFIEGGIEFHFDSGFNGGRIQTFVIEYRSATNPESVWKNISVTDLKEKQAKYQLPNGTYFLNVTQPKPGSYLYRMYSWNAIGRGPYSEEVSVFISEGETTHRFSNPMVAAIAGSAVTAVVVIAGVALIYILVNRRLLSKRKSSGSCLSRELIYRRGQDIAGAVYENMPVRNANISPDNVYENALAVGRFGADVHDDDGNVYENQHGVDMSLLRSNGNLIYADLELPNPTTNNGRPIIHGLENRTDYAEIAFGKRGKSLPDSDDETEVLAADGGN